MARQSCPMVPRWRFFCVLYFQRAACSTFQTCILNSHKGHTMCGSMVDIQFATAEIKRGKEPRKKDENIMSASATQGGHNKWSNYFDIKPHRRRTWTVQSYSPGGANVHPIYRKTKIVATATSLSCRVSTISAFCWSTTSQTHSITNCLVVIVHTKPVIAILVPNWLPWQRPLDIRSRLYLNG